MSKITFVKKTVTITFEFLHRDIPSQKGLFYRTTWEEQEWGYEITIEYANVKDKLKNETWLQIGNRLFTIQFPTRRQSLKFLRDIINLTHEQTNKRST